MNFARDNIVYKIKLDYRGEIGIILINLGQEPQTINPGDRIAQMVCARVEHMELEEVQDLNKTERGEGGYGHSGVR